MPDYPRHRLVPIDGMKRSEKDRKRGVREAILTTLETLAAMGAAMDANGTAALANLVSAYRGLED